jgi:hypothetical protein
VEEAKNKGHNGTTAQRRKGKKRRGGEGEIEARRSFRVLSVFRGKKKSFNHGVTQLVPLRRESLHGVARLDKPPFGGLGVANKNGAKAQREEEERGRGGEGEIEAK